MNKRQNMIELQNEPPCDFCEKWNKSASYCMSDSTDCRLTRAAENIIKGEDYDPDAYVRY